jgi:hypothetical protein
MPLPAPVTSAILFVAVTTRPPGNKLFANVPRLRFRGSQVRLSARLPQPQIRIRGCINNLLCYNISQFADGTHA